jgi:hypothetical protein
MSRFNFAIDPDFVAQNRVRAEPPQEITPLLAFFSWTMFSAVSLATGAAALVFFA